MIHSRWLNWGKPAALVFRQQRNELRIGSCCTLMAAVQRCIIVALCSLSLTAADVRRFSRTTRAEAFLLGLKYLGNRAHTSNIQNHQHSRPMTPLTMMRTKRNSASGRIHATALLTIKRVRWRPRNPLMPLAPALLLR
ncbi:hypothetical protein BJX64DRAFT_175695 [Aspergillus heterothallicus]